MRETSSKKIVNKKSEKQICQDIRYPAASLISSYMLCAHRKLVIADDNQSARDRNLICDILLSWRRYIICDFWLGWSSKLVLKENELIKRVRRTSAQEDDDMETRDLRQPQKYAFVKVVRWAKPTQVIYT